MLLLSELCLPTYTHTRTYVCLFVAPKAVRNAPWIHNHSAHETQHAYARNTKIKRKNKNNYSGDRSKPTLHNFSVVCCTTLFLSFYWNLLIFSVFCWDLQIFVFFFLFFILLFFAHFAVTYFYFYIIIFYVFLFIFLQ